MSHHFDSRVQGRALAWCRVGKLLPCAATACNTSTTKIAINHREVGLIAVLNRHNSHAFDLSAKRKVNSRPAQAQKKISTGNSSKSWPANLPALRRICFLGHRLPKFFIGQFNVVTPLLYRRGSIDLFCNGESPLIKRDCRDVLPLMQVDVSHVR